MGSVCQVSAIPLLGAFSCGLLEGESDPGEQVSTMFLIFNSEESQFIIRVWGGKPHRKIPQSQAKDQKQGLRYNLD